ncbi:MAG TPA: hypothetical protein VKU19_27795 [Bryobacteraceae bacterium]|nr:hypothetical protein [Bryobacteraceae bacterium]
MENNKWVEERIAILKPPVAWTPDTAAALQRHRVRRQDEWRRGPGFWWKFAMAAAILLAIGLAPPTRGLAQRIWRSLTVGRIEVVRVDLSDLPADSSLRARMIQGPGKMTRADNAESARALAGFLPRLPGPGSLNGTPELSVASPAAAEIVLKADDLRLLLQRAGIDESVPPEWDGARIVVQTGGLVMAEWHASDTMLIQLSPVTMLVPDRFDLRAFTTLALRGLKVPREEAERLGARMASTPAWLLPVRPGEKVGIRDVALRSGTATMIYDLNPENPGRIERLTLVWSAPDRVYILSGPMSDSLAIATANSIE